MEYIIGIMIVYLVLWLLIRFAASLLGLVVDLFVLAVNLLTWLIGLLTYAVLWIAGRPSTRRIVDHDVVDRIEPH